MEVTQNFTCECNGHTHMYKSRSGLVQHKKSAAHQSWETTKELKDERCRRTLLENQNAALKKEISDLKEELRRVYRRIILENDSIES
jgi:chaperonin cofactor prefoldin